LISSNLKDILLSNQLTSKQHATLTASFGLPAQYGEESLLSQPWISLFSLSEHMLSSVECNKVLTLFLNGVAPYVIRGLAQHWTTRLPLIIDGFHDPLAKAATSSSIKWRRFGPKRDHCLWHFMDVCGTLLILERS
jgi:hypothetical protein